MILLLNFRGLQESVIHIQQPDSADEFLKAVGNLGPVPYDNPESNRAQGYLRKGQDYADPEAVDESLRRSSEQMEAAEDLERGIKAGVFGGDGVRASQVV